MMNEQPLDLYFVEAFENLQNADKAATTAFLTVLKMTIKDEMLPLPDSNLLDMIRDVDDDVDFSETSWDDFSTFLKHMDKRRFFVRSQTAEQKLVNKDIFYITSINRDHPEIEALQVAESSKKKDEGFSAGDPFTDPAYAKARVTDGDVTVCIMWKPSGRLNDIFMKNNPDHHPTSLYTKNDCMRRLWDWCADQDLIMPSRKNEIRTNDAFWKIIMKPKKDKRKELPPEAPRTIHRKEALEMYMRWMQKHCGIKTPGLRRPKWKAGDLTKINVYVEKRQGGHKKKHVTFVWQLEEYGIDLKEFQKAATKKFAASTNIHALPGKTRKGELVKVQGDRAYEIEGLLLDQFNITSRFVEITTKRPF